MNYKKPSKSTTSINPSDSTIIQLSKTDKKLQDIQRMHKWNELAQTKSSEKKTAVKQNLLSTKLTQTVVPESKQNIKPRSSVILKVDKTSVGKRKHGEREKTIELNEYYPKLFSSKYFKRIQLDNMNPTLPKIVFAGRSNVGKSSLINALVTKTGKGGKAAVSSKPGETQSLNCYQLSDAINVVDLPGYGFAFAEEEKRMEWQEQIRNFLLSASKLRRVYILIDVRHGFKETDYSFLTFLNQNKIKNQIVLTKCDLLYDDEIAKQYEYLINQIRVRPFNHTCEEMIVVSSKKMNGIKEIQEEILSFLPEKGAKYREIKTRHVPLPDVPLISPPKPLTIKDNSSPQISYNDEKKKKNIPRKLSAITQRKSNTTGRRNSEKISIRRK